MKVYNGLYSLFIYTLIFLGAVGHTGCANIMPPTGGPKDTIPPRLVSALPKDSAKRFTEKKIVLTFNEYVDGKDIRTELLVNPVPKVDPIVDAKLKVVTVRIKDTLKASTTYSLQFGRGIRDVNEGNVLRNFIYVFSTGDTIDRGELEGNVVVANTGRPDSSLIALLYTSFDDSAVIKERPRYIARLDTTGYYHFRYVKPGKYALYALKDEGGSHKYLSKSQLFAFASSPVEVGGPTPAETLYAYSEIAEGKKSSSGTSGGTGGGATPAPAPKKPKKEDTRLQVQTNASNGQFDILDTLKLTFSGGLKFFDSTQIRFTDEDYRDIESRLYRMVRDSTGKIVELLRAWPTDTKFHVIIPRTFGQDSMGRRLSKDDTISFKTRKDIDYGEVQVRVSNLSLTLHPVLQFVQGGQVKYAIPFNSRRIVRQVLFPPGEYELRILYDTNRNGVWDPGSFFGKDKKQPERVITIRKKMNVKANWDNDWDTTL
ncbi:MAG TPA: Ig-like domain-containing domain [Puia sp.]|nr:Ig-like domain-containing domain [Puia sp.]